MGPFWVVHTLHSHEHVNWVLASTYQSLINITCLNKSSGLEILKSGLFFISHWAFQDFIQSKSYNLIISGLWQALVCPLPLLCW